MQKKMCVIKSISYPQVFTEYSNDMNNIYNDIEEYNPNKKRKILKFF